MIKKDDIFTNNHGYTKLGTAGLGFGLRNQRDHHGYDLGVKTIPSFFYLAEANYLYFFKKEHTSTYCGLGAVGGLIKMSHTTHPIILPALTYGYQNKSGMFFQTQMIYLFPSIEFGFLF